MSYFTVYGGDIPVHGEGVISFNCYAMLVCYAGKSVFVYTPMYEIGQGELTYIGAGVGVSVIPDIKNLTEVCRTLLGSSGFSIQVEPIALEQVLSIDGIFEHAEDHPTEIPTIRLPELAVRFPTSKGFVDVANKVEGGLVVKIY